MLPLCLFAHGRKSLQSVTAHFIHWQVARSKAASEIDSRHRHRRGPSHRKNKPWQNLLTRSICCHRKVVVPNSNRENLPIAQFQSVSLQKRLGSNLGFCWLQLPSVRNHEQGRKHLNQKGPRLSSEPVPWPAQTLHAACSLHAVLKLILKESTGRQQHLLMCMHAYTTAPSMVRAQGLSVKKMEQSCRKLCAPSVSMQGAGTSDAPLRSANFTKP